MIYDVGPDDEPIGAEHESLPDVVARPDAPDVAIGERRLSLLWRVFFANAAVLVAAFVVLLVTPITVSAPTATFAEAVILLAGLMAALAVNLVVLRRSFAPLRRLTALMGVIDPMEPGRRVVATGHDAEVAALTGAFNAMLDRLEMERRDSGLRALAAQEEGQLRIARELHDEFGQTLTAIAIQAEHAAENASDDQEAWAGCRKSRSRAARGCSPDKPRPAT